MRQAAELAHQRDTSMRREDRDIHYLEASNADLPLIISKAVLDGLLQEHEVADPARDLIVDSVGTLRAIRQSRAEEAPEDDEDPYTPDAPVSVSAIVREANALTDEDRLYVNRVTGEVVILGPEKLEMMERDLEDDEIESAPQWERDAMKKALEMAESGDWLCLPDKFDIHEWEIMKRFAMTTRPSVERTLLDAIHGKGAFRRFHEVVDREGIQGQWDEFRTESIAKIIRSALHAAGVPFRR